METDFATRIASLPQYQELKAKRSSFGWWLTLAIPVGFGVIVFTIIITAVYVRRANSEFDALFAAISKAVLK